MLRRLKVENYALIDRLELELDDRLNIITGETGAGKSILLGALGLLLGNKNDNATLKDDKRNCLIEGVFDLGTRDLQAFFDRNDLDYSRETTLTRQITPAGKSRSFINDTPVPLALLRELGSQLIDIHSQHQNLILDQRLSARRPSIRSPKTTTCGCNIRPSTNGSATCAVNSHGCAKRPKPDARTKSGSATRSKNSQRPT